MIDDPDAADRASVAPTFGDAFDASPIDATERGSQRIELLPVVDALPSLGPVLWLERSAPAHARTTRHAGPGLLLEHPALAPLARCASVTAHCAVTPNGPREWICFHDLAGTTQARLFLLPDSDYLAWDEMTAGRVAHARAPLRPWQPHAAFLRGAFARLAGGWRARVFAFRLRQLRCLRMLSASPPLRMSLFGLELACAIAADEGAELALPLHAA